MNVPIDHQVIKKNGKPVFAVIPYDEYLELLKEKPDEEVLLPHEVVRMHGLEDKSLVRAWREYKGMTQQAVADRMGISQASYAAMEKPDANLRYATMKKLARALEVEIEQIKD